MTSESSIKTDTLDYMSSCVQTDYEMTNSLGIPMENISFSFIMVNPENKFEGEEVIYQPMYGTGSIISTSNSLAS